MGLLETIQTAAGIAFAAAGDFMVSVSYTSKAAQTYSTSTGAVTAPTQTTITVLMIMAPAKSREIDGVAVLRNDLWAIVHVDGISVTPKESDEIVYSSKTYRVVGVTKLIESGAVAWKLLLRVRK